MHVHKATRWTQQSSVVQNAALMELLCAQRLAIASSSVAARACFINVEQCTIV